MDGFFLLFFVRPFVRYGSTFFKVISRLLFYKNALQCFTVLYSKAFQNPLEIKVNFSQIIIIVII